MVAVDITIANVALPHMQSTLSASQDQIVWVLTSYLVAGAIATPLTGWLAEPLWSQADDAGLGRRLHDRLGAVRHRRQTWTMIVFARAAAGRVRRGAGAAEPGDRCSISTRPSGTPRRWRSLRSDRWLGPLIGPTLGGWLTDSLSWRWVFFINLPFGVLSFLLMMPFMYDSRDEHPGRFDMFGFGALAIALGAVPADARPGRAARLVRIDRNLDLCGGAGGRRLVSASSTS